MFSIHSVVKVPPYSKLDLLSCSNVLIYIIQDLRDRVPRSFHYALLPNSILFLEPSEGTTRLASAFAALDKRNSIFTRLDSETMLPELSLAPHATVSQPMDHKKSPFIEDRTGRNAWRALEQYAPVYVVIYRGQDIVRFSGGNMGGYLEPSSGAASLKLFGLLRKSLRPAVRAALLAVAKTNQPVLHEDIALTIDGKRRLL